MRILKVSIKNLASLPEAEIDFTKEPLADAPLFLICGDTGAGKSTITDAICLALYGKAPRFSDSQQDDFGNEDSLKTGDVRNFMRKGTAESMAAVDFVADDGSTCRAEWQSRRARGKADGKLQDTRRTIYRLNEAANSWEPVAEKAAEYNAMIEQLTGYDYSRFARAVLLAQNQFSKFLLAKRDDKSAILQMLTNTDIYEKISRKIYEKYSAAKNELDVLAKTIQSHPDVTDCDIAKSREELANMEKLSAESDSSLQALSLKIQWKKRFVELGEILRQKQEALCKAQQEASQMAGKRQWLMRAEIAVREFRPIVMEIDKCKSTLDAVKADFRKTGSKYRQYLSLLAELQSMTKACSASLAQRSASLEAMQPNANIYDNVQTISQLIKNLIEADRNLDIQRQKISEIDGNIAHQNARLQKILPEFQAIEAQSADAASKFAAADASLNAFDYDGLNALKQDLAKQERYFDEAKALLSDKARLDADLALKASQLEAARQSVREISGQIDSICQRQKTLEIEYDSQKELFDRQKLAVAKDMKKMRAQLEDGQPCPLCGSTSHPYSQPGLALDSIYKETEALLAQKAAAIKSLLEQKAKLEGAASEKNSQAAAMESLEIPRLRGEIDRLSARCARLSEYCLNAYGKDLAKDGREAFEAESQKIMELGNDKMRRLDIQYQQLKAAFDSARKDSEAKAAALQKMKEQKAEIERQIDIKGAERKSTADSIALGENSQSLLLERLRGYFDGIANEPGSLAALQQSTESDARKFSLLKKEVEDLRIKAARLADIVQGCSNISELEKIFPGMEPLPCGGSCRVEQLPSLLASILEQARMLIRQERDTENAIVSAQKILDGKISEENAKDPSLGFDADNAQALSKAAGADIQTLRSEIMAVDRRLGECEQSRRDAECSLDAHIKANELGVGEAESCEALAAQYDVNKQEADCRKTRLGELRAQIARQEADVKSLGELKRRRQAAQRLFEDWLPLNSALGGKEGKSLRNMAQVFTLRILLSNADRRLQRLTGKYRLRCGGDSLAILVEDMEMSVCRPATTLSGGECFMVSLALALGLSDMMRGGRGSEMLFIDEGFGTLDQQALDSVISMLEKLHLQGRKVGIISHVPELAERISAKILVRKCIGDNTRSEVLVQGD